jgi:phosphatidate cytidylyltransferase
MVRVASGVVMALVALGAIVWLPQAAFRAVIAALAGAAAAEFAPLAGRRTLFARGLVVAVSALSAWVLAADPLNMPAVSLVALSVGAGVVLGRRRSIPFSLATLFAVLYIGVPFALIANLRATSGWRATALLVATIAVSDSLQYYSGRLFGRRPLAPTVSPKKTIEGAAGGVVGTAVFLLLVAPAVLPDASRAGATAFGVVVALLGIAGDLFESQLKRVAGVKDSSHLLPGHGGVLDRVDALLFATPAFYLFARSLG